VVAYGEAGVQAGGQRRQIADPLVVRRAVRLHVDAAEPHASGLRFDDARGDAQQRRLA
jgi:hypothetical protein